jgi:hypothetical protein
MNHYSFFQFKKTESINEPELSSNFNSLNLNSKKEVKKEVKNPNSGYLYILYNPIFKEYGKNIYKLGRTNNLINRMKSYTTSYIEPSKFLYTSIFFDDCIQAERILFFLLRRYRIRDKREFFNFELENIIETIQKIENCTTNQINKIYNKIVCKICPDDIMDKLDDEEYNRLLDFDYSDIRVFLEQFRFKPCHPSRYKMYNYTPPQTSELNYILYQIEENEVN